MATASNTQFKVENGLLVVGGNANLDVNTTITSTLSATANLSFTGKVVSNFIPNSDDTYSLGNTSLRWIVNASTITANTLNASSNVWVFGTAATFNANTGVANATDVITTQSAHGFSTGEYVQYTTSTGNTALSGLTNASLYYVVSTPTATSLTLSATYGGAQVNITASATSETGHNLTPVRIILSPNGSIFAPASASVANVGTLRVLGSTIMTGNLAVDTDLLFIDAVNNSIGLKNTAPLSTDLVTVGGNVVFNAANTTGVRLITSNTSYNTSITLMANTTNSRFTFTTWGSSNSSVNDGGYLLNLVNSTSTYAGLLINLNKFEYLSGNVAHKGNFGIYDVSGTRVGP